MVLHYIDEKDDETHATTYHIWRAPRLVLRRIVVQRRAKFAFLDARPRARMAES